MRRRRPRPVGPGHRGTRAPGPTGAYPGDAAGTPVPAATGAPVELTGWAYAFRPGSIEPEHDARPRVGWIRAVYTLLTPLSALPVRLAPGVATSTSRPGRAMLAVARRRPERRVWGSRDIADV